MNQNKDYVPKHETETLSRELLQALADLGYPKGIRETMGIRQAEEIIKGNIRYKPIEYKVETALPPKEEIKTESKPINIPEYQGDEKQKAAYNLELDKLKELVKETKDTNIKDEGLNTLLHLATTMAFRDFSKACEVIEFLKSKGANIFLKNNQDQTPIEIAEQRAKITPEYQKIVDALKE